MVGYEPKGELINPQRRAGMGLREVVFILFRRRWVVLAVALPIILVGGLNLIGRAGTYTAAARVLIELSNVDQPRWNTNSRSIDYDREMSTFVNIGLSLAVADIATEALADSLPTVRSIDPNLAMLEGHNDFRDVLIGGLDINVVGESNILEFRHTAENPRVALMATGALRDAFIKYQNESKRNLGAVDYYAEQIAVIHGSIDSLLALRTQVMGEFNYTSLEDDLKHATGMAADAETKLRKAVVIREQLEVEYHLLRGYLDRDPKIGRASCRERV